MRATGAKRGKTRASEARLVLDLLLIGWESGANFGNQSQSAVKQNQSKHEISFDTIENSLYIAPMAYDIRRGFPEAFMSLRQEGEDIFKIFTRFFLSLVLGFSPADSNARWIWQWQADVFSKRL